MNDTATDPLPRTPITRSSASGQHARVGAMGLALAMLVSACSGPLPTGGAGPALSAPGASTNAAASTEVIAFAGDQIVPDDLDDAVAVSAGDHHSLAVREDGTVVSGGLDDLYEENGFRFRIGNQSFDAYHG